MIDRKIYSTDVIKVQFNIGGLETEIFQKQIINIIQNTHELIADYAFKNVGNQVVIVLTLPIQVIPEIVLALAQNNMAIYEVSKFIE